MIPTWLSEHPDLRATLVRSGAPGVSADWPDWLPTPVVEALGRAGIQQGWRHQIEAAECAHSGCPTIVSTPTASGKSLAYLLPVLAATWGGTPTSAPPPPELPGRRTPRALLKREHTALYLAPTKALAHDQGRACADLGIDSWRHAVLDGDSSSEQRAWARDHATFLLTNPDLLHHSILPGHQRWQGFLKSLRYVVIDEAHHYQGVFGMQVALVLRRLRRICRNLGADPVLIGASATLAAPAATLSALTGVEADQVAVVDKSTAPRPPTRLLICRPEDPRGTVTELFTRLADSQLQTCAFVGSRARAEELAAAGRRAGIAARAYRAGLLPHERRELEQRLERRELLAIASTSALELGVDVGGLDVVLLDAHPGDPTALWQRIGRAGRRDREGVAVLVAGDNPLDAWWCDHPDELLAGDGAPPPAMATDRVLAPQLAAAAQEQPLTGTDEYWFGPRYAPLADRLAEAGILRRRPTGWFWVRPDRAVDSIDLRSCGQQVEVCEPDTGRVIGTLDSSRADRELHPGAVYRHQGDTWLVGDEGAGPRDELVYARPARPGYLTVARSISRVTELAGEARPLGHGLVACGPVRVLGRVTSFLRLDEVTGSIWDETPLDLPERQLDTAAIWFDLEPSALPDWSPARARAATHALEHALSSLLGVVLPPGPRALTGWTEMPTAGGCWRIGLHEQVAGGSGLVEAASARVDQWWAAVLDRLSRCECSTGCPRCILSPSCPDGNRDLDRVGALELARLFTATAPHAPGPAPHRAAQVLVP